MSKRKLFYSLPAGIRLIVRQLYYLPQDMWDSISNSRKEMIPPKGMIYTGGGNFEKTGLKFLEYFIKYGKLTKDSAVLDVGSGLGRMAIPLTKYLSKTSKYRGFDVVKKGVDWCQKEISSRYPNFQFEYIDLSNDLYKSTGKDPKEFIFPYEGQQFDLAILISVFTHMSLEEVLHYLDEIFRILKPGGRCFSTFFTYDQDTQPSKKNFTFPYQFEGFALMDEKVKSANIALDINILKLEIEKRGFEVDLYNKGEWQQSNAESLDFQDIVVFRKK